MNDMETMKKICTNIIPMKIEFNSNTLIIRITGGTFIFLGDFEIPPPAPYFDPPFILFRKSNFRVLKSM